MKDKDDAKKNVVGFIFPEDDDLNFLVYGIMKQPFSRQHSDDSQFRTKYIAIEAQNTYLIKNVFDKK